MGMTRVDLTFRLTIALEGGAMAKDFEMRWRVEE